VEAPVDGHVQIGGDRATELLAGPRLARRVDADATQDGKRRRILADLLGLITHHRRDLLHVVRRQPVRDHAVGDAHGLANHALLEGRHIDRHAVRRRPPELEARHL
jgi:hypothetical protein